MEDSNEIKYHKVNAIRDPLSLQVKLTVMNKVQFEYGINLFLGSPLETKPSLEGQFLVCHEDIDNTPEKPQVIVLPKDALKIQDVDIPSIGDFDAKLKLKKYITKTWFTTKTATTVMGLAKIPPLPSFLAFDAFNEDTPYHIIDEQIQDNDEEGNQNSYYSVFKRFIQAVHTSRKVSAYVDVPARSGARGRAPLVWSPVYTGL